MSYGGYRLQIGNDKIWSEIVEPGSYTATPTTRFVRKWVDANQIEHHDAVGTKMVIQFSIRVRTMSEQDTIKAMFATKENLSVTYWDDTTSTYQTGTFYMDDMSFNNINSQAQSILYNATPIKLTEY